MAKVHQCSGRESTSLHFVNGSLHGHASIGIFWPIFPSVFSRTSNRESHHPQTSQSRFQRLNVYHPTSTKTKNFKLQLHVFRNQYFWQPPYVWIKKTHGWTISYITLHSSKRVNPSDPSEGNPPTSPDVSEAPRILVAADPPPWSWPALRDGHGYGHGYWVIHRKTNIRTAPNDHDHIPLHCLSLSIIIYHYLSFSIIIYIIYHYLSKFKCYPMIFPY